MEITHQGFVQRSPWNKRKQVGQKAALKQREIWAIRIRLQLAERTRELALFNLAVDSRLRSCDLVQLFPSRLRASPHLSTRQYARIVRSWVRQIGLNPAGYGTHTLRRTKAALIYRSL
jgi:hypothetical protein